MESRAYSQVSHVIQSGETLQQERRRKSRNVIRRSSNKELITNG